MNDTTYAEKAENRDVIFVSMGCIQVLKLSRENCLEEMSSIACMLTMVQHCQN